MILNQIILNSLVYNEAYSRIALPHIKAEYFQNLGEQHVFGMIDTFVNEFGTLPTPEALAAILERKTLAEGIYNDALNIITEMEPQKEDTKWLIKESQAWALDNSLANAVKRANRVYQGEDELTREQLPDLFAEANSVSFDEDLGHFYWEQASKHYDLQHDEQVKLPFKVKILNQITRGGVSPKTLNIVLAGINVGKTTFLIDRACEQCELGKNVLYITCEVEERVIRHRSDVRMLDVNFDRLESMTKNEYLAYITKKRRATSGEFVIKEFPAGVCTASMIKQYVKSVEQKRGIKFDIIVVDYLTEMASGRLPIHMVSNTNVYYGSVARELRALAFEFEVPVWTAMQLTRDKQDGLNARVSDTADAISIPKVADLMFSVGMEDSDSMLKQALVSQMKNRYDDKSKLRSFRIGLDNDRQLFFDLGYDQQEGILDEKQIAYLKGKKDYIVAGEDPHTLKQEDSVESWTFGV